MNLQSFRMKSSLNYDYPMIDIIFFLLVFFMMNSLQTIAQKALSVQLPLDNRICTSSITSGAYIRCRRSYND